MANSINYHLIDFVPSPMVEKLPTLVGDSILHNEVCAFHVTLKLGFSMSLSSSPREKVEVMSDNINRYYLQGSSYTFFLSPSITLAESLT